MLSGFPFVRRLPTRHAGPVWQTDLPAGKSARGAPPLHGDVVSPCVYSHSPLEGHGTATASEVVIQAAATPTAVLCLGQVVASQPIVAAAVGATARWLIQWWCQA